MQAARIPTTDPIATIECSICFGIISRDEKKYTHITGAETDHNFHLECIELAKNASRGRKFDCPICRKDITESLNIRLGVNPHMEMYKTALFTLTIYSIGIAAGIHPIPALFFTGGAGYIWQNPDCITDELENEEEAIVNTDLTYIRWA